MGAVVELGEIWEIVTARVNCSETRLSDCTLSSSRETYTDRSAAEHNDRIREARSGAS